MADNFRADLYQLLLQRDLRPVLHFLLQAVHESAKGLHEAGVMDETTMREFDAMCLPPVKEYTAKDIGRVRLSQHVSQPSFAAYLNVAKSTLAH